MSIQPTDGDALLAVDLQNDFCSAGALAVAGGELIVPLVNRLTARFPTVVATQDWHPRGHLSFASSHSGKSAFQAVQLSYGEQVLWPDHCVQGTFGAEFHRDFDLAPCQIVVRKGFRPGIDSYSAFRENDRSTLTGLGGYLRERAIGRVFICGLATDFCVAYSALDAHQAGFQAVVIEDACRAIDLDGSLAMARKTMEAAGVLIAQSSDVL